MSAARATSGAQRTWAAALGSAVVVLIGAPSAAAVGPHSRASEPEAREAFRNGIEWGRASAEGDLQRCRERLGQADAIIFGSGADDHDRASRYAKCLIDIRSAAQWNRGSLDYAISRCTAEFPQ